MLPTGPVVEAGASHIADLQLRNNRRLASVGLALVALPAVWFVRTDLALFGGDWSALTARFSVRLALVVLPLAGILLLHSVGSQRDYSRRLCFICAGIAAALLALCLMRPVGSGLPLRSPLFTIALLYAALPNTRWRQILPPLVLSAGLIGLEVAWLGSAGTDVAGDVVIIVALNLAGWFIVDRRLRLENEVEAAWQREQAAHAELRTLRGIIPICAHCKNVRTELGDWEQIEGYVRDRSAAEFSHGVCPDCLRRHYPEVADEAAG